METHEVWKVCNEGDFTADRDWRKLSDKSLSSCKHWTNIIVPVRQKSRYNQLSLYQIRKMKYTSVPVNTELRFYYVARLRDYKLDNQYW